MVTRAKEVRVAAGLSITAAAALAGVSPHTWKLREAGGAVSPPKERQCEAAEEQMTKMAELRKAS